VEGAGATGQVRVAYSVLRRVERVAQRNGLSAAQVVRLALRRWVKGCVHPEGKR
jgi:antitoxin component of RelBE/YafQ-DinJ toxin-antitoxin module